MKSVIQATMSGTKKYFFIWSSRTRNLQALNKCRMSIDFFEKISNIFVQNQLYFILTDDKSNQLKVKSIKKLISNTNNSIGIVLKKWQTNAHVITV